VKGIALSSPTYGLRRLYTWKAPDQSQHQLDYILVKHQFRNSKKDMQAMHRADIYSASDLVVAEVCTRLKKIIKFQTGKPRWNLEKLHAL
jgi:hypothetical protein